MVMLLGTWELGYGYGHIAHLAPLAHALKARGHRMAVAARNPATAKAAPGEPFDAILQPPGYRPAKRKPTPTLTYGQVVADGGMTDLPAAIQLVRAWLALFDRVKPEAIVAEHAPVSVLAAHVARLPVAMIGSGFMVPPASRPSPSLLPWTSAGEAELIAADAPADQVVRKVCRAFGAPPLGGLAALLATAYPYLTTWPELDFCGPRAGATYYGPLGGFAGRARPDWPTAAGPRLFVYVPFEHPRAGELVEALGALGWPAIWHAARPPAIELPGHVRFSPEPVDLPHMLADAAFIVGRGAHGTACQALIAGRPHLMLPDTLETMLTARQIANRQLGTVVTAPGVSAVRAALEGLAGDDDIAAAAAAAKARYGSYRSELAAAQLAEAIIEEFALGPASPGPKTRYTAVRAITEGG